MGRKVTWYGLLIALAMILSYVEVLVPFHFVVPGVKLGLANLAVFVALYTEGVKGAATISIVRIFLVSFTFGNAYSMLYSLAGGILSLTVMAICKQTKLLSKVGVSILGGVCHNIGQIFVAAYVVRLTQIFYYLPVLLIAGAVTGAVIGILGRQVMHNIKNIIPQ